MNLSLRSLWWTLFVIFFIGCTIPLAAQETIPISSVADLLYDNFDRGNWLSDWGTVKGNAPTIVDGRGAKVLQVTVNTDNSYLSRTDKARADEGYLTFWFNPNNVSIPEQNASGNISWIPSKSIVIAEVNGKNKALVALHLQKPITSTNYKVYLRWNMFTSPDKSQQQFETDNKGNLKLYDLPNNWQKITIGYKVNQWVSLWIDNKLIQSVTPITHASEYRAEINIGKILTSSLTTESSPSGTILYDEVHFAVPKINDLWVDANKGNDTNDGYTKETPFITIQRAASLARPGTTIHIMSGIYREMIVPANDGQPNDPITYTAETSGTVKIRGSIKSSTLKWTQLTANSIGLPDGIDPTNIYYAELKTAPSFVIQADKDVRLPMAREPDEKIATEWKHSEFWWTANGGSAVENCNPAKDGQKCDAATRSRTQLTDNQSDVLPNGIESGNLTTLGNLTGATIFVLDTNSGHYFYKRGIDSHDVANGLITIVTPDDGERECIFPGQTPDGGLGWGSKYFVEGLPQLLDNKGEWWYDEATKRLYLWPLTSGSPSNINIEISQKENGFNLSDRSYLILDGLTIEYFNDYAIYLENIRRKDISSASKNIILKNMALRYADRGIYIYQATDNDSTHVTDGFTLADSKISYMDTAAFTINYVWGTTIGQNTAEFDHAGVINTVIRGNEMHHLGFRNNAKGSDTANGATFHYADKVRFEGNHVHDVASNGIFFSHSLIQPGSDDPTQKSDFDPSEIKVGEILVKDNIFEKACQLSTDCGGLKFWGASEGLNTHVFRDVLIMGNIMRDNYGWAYVSEQRNKWSMGSVKGMGGFGLYIDMSSGIYAYRNMAYDNAYSDYNFNELWQDGVIIFYNNLAANSLYGFQLNPLDFDWHGSFDTQIANNIIINNERYGNFLLKIENTDFGKLLIDNNLYFSNGWSSAIDQANKGDMGFFLRDRIGENGTLFNYKVITDARTLRPTNTAWEDNGFHDNPYFAKFNFDNHNIHDNSVFPDFHLTFLSDQAIDQGRSLPASLEELLKRFGIEDAPIGAGYDIGPNEFDRNGITSAFIYLPVILKQ